MRIHKLILKVINNFKFSIRKIVQSILVSIYFSNKRIIKKKN